MATDATALAPADSPRSRARYLTVEGGTVTTLAAAAAGAGAALPLLPFYPGIACPLRAVTGVPCPSCGMTGSIQSCLGLDFAQAFAQNPGGVGLLAGAAALLWKRPRQVRLPLAGVLAAVAALWLFQLMRFDLIL